MVQVCEPADVAKLDQSRVRIVNAIRKLATGIGRNTKVGISIGETRPDP